jgi:1,4-alpha-glucan branching enzyme
MTTTSQQIANCRDDTSSPTAATSCSVQFSMQCLAWRVCLVIGDESGNARSMHQMDKDKESRWQLTLRLSPGRYRYRYYADHGGAALYVRPDEAEDLPLLMEGLDAVLTVSP